MEEQIVNPTPSPKTKKIDSSLYIPISIVIAGAFMALALYFSLGTSTQVAVDKVEPKVAAPADTTSAIRKITPSDYIKGSLDAPIKIVTYSDFECPFCKRHHETMNALMDKYSKTGEVAWVFRQFPLDSLHPVKARSVAIASECVGEQGGNDSFWKFADRYFDLTLTNNRTDIDKVVPQILSEIAINKAKFDACVASDKYTEKIEADIANAMETGGRGTPWSIVVAANGKTFPINGAQPITEIERLITEARKAI